MTELPDRAPANGEDAAADGSQFVTFLLSDATFAAPMTPVQEIIRVPEVVRVPLAPDHLLGLANLRGHVLPIVSLRHIFNLPEVEHTEATRAVVINLGSPVGFVVDCVASVMSVDDGQIESVGTIRSAVRSDMLSGVIKTERALVMLIDFQALIDREFASLARQVAALQEAAGQMEAQSDGEAESDEVQLVSFIVAEQEYGVPIADVQEIVQVPELVTQVPEAPDYLIGLITLRARLLPLVSLRQLFGLGIRALSETDRIVVVDLGGLSVGLVMDRVSEVLRVPQSLVDDVPGLLDRAGGLAEITSICRLNEGRRLVSVIRPQALFENDALATLDAARSAVKEVDTVREDSEQDGEGELSDEAQVVVFRLGREEFGVPIDSVQEIVRVPDELTRVPKAPDFVEGVINLRGTVLPVIDQRRRFGLDDSERSDRQRIMVYLFNGARTGFIVDSVAEVMKIPFDAIEDAPTLSAEQARLIGRVANLQKQGRMVMMIDPARLLEANEVSALDGMAA